MYSYSMAQLSLRCRLLQYAVFVGINGWHGNNIFSIFSVSCYGILLFKLFEGEIRQLLEEKDLQCIIKQLSDSVFVICKIINVLVRVI